MARVPTGNPRGRPKGLAKTGGRVAGKSLDRQARQLVSSELAGSILATFEQLGGTADMVKWAKANRTVFYTQVLARLMPAPQKDEPDVVQNNQFNFDGNPMEAARRVAFILACGVHGDPSRVPIDVTPVEPEPQYVDPNKLWVPPSDAPDMPDPDKQRWVEELPLTAEQRADQALMRQTRTDTLENYAGGPGEQGGSSSAQRQSAESDPRAAQRERMQRRKQLL